MHRFFAPALDPGDETVALPRGEAEHLVRVLRLGVGDTVHVFDGRGHEFVARVASAVRRDVRLQLMSRVEPPAEASVALTLAQAVLKADGRSRSGPPRGAAACGSSRSAIARCAPTRSRSRRSACCSFCGGISNARKSEV